MRREKNMRGPKPGQGDHRKGAAQAGEAKPAVPGWGKEVKNKRVFGHHKVDPVTSRNPSLPTYGGEKRSHPFFGEARRTRIGFMTGDVKLNREVDKR